MTTLARIILATFLALLVAIPARGDTVVSCVGQPVVTHRACCASAERDATPAKCCVVTRLPAQPRQASPAIPPIPGLALLPFVTVPVVLEPAPVASHPQLTEIRPRDGPDPHECQAPRGPPALV